GKMVGPGIRRAFELDVAGMIADDQLEMSVGYNKNQFKPGTVSNLLQHFKTHLEQLIAFCLSRETRELTPSDFIYKKLSIEALECIQKKYPAGIEHIYPLTPMQEGMLFHNLYETGSSVYFEQMCYRLHGELDVGIVEKSINRLFKRYDILRTAFIHKDMERPLQVVLSKRKLDVYYKDISEESSEEKTMFVETFKKEDRERSFDLSNDVLMRVAVLRLGRREYEFTWSHHHILLDGWCLGILITEFFDIYNSILSGHEPRLNPVKPYRNY
ncbi:MAG: hypothetical protein GY757_34470, partial [bacterium]|nr:hypothetical protein [bacterium]